MNQPNTPGLYSFQGIRHDRNRSAIVSVDAWVEVRNVLKGRVTELAVHFWDNPKLFPLTDFSGVWKKLKP